MYSILTLSLSVPQKSASTYRSTFRARWCLADVVYLRVGETRLRGWELCLCPGSDWNGAIFPSPPFFSWQGFCLSGQGTNSVTCPAGMQIFAAKSLGLPRPVLSRGTCSLAWPAAVDTSLASAHPPHCCQNHLQSKKIQPRFPAQNPPVTPTGLVLLGRARLPVENLGSKMDSHPRGRKGAFCLKSLPSG